MFLSKSCAYAVRALLLVGQYRKAEENGKIGLAAISEQLEIPNHFLGKILQILTKHGLLSSTKGQGGGFYLTEDQLTTPLLDVVTLIDGKDIFEKCALGLKICTEKRPCPVHRAIKPLKDELLNTLERETIESMVDSLSEGGIFLVVR